MATRQSRRQLERAAARNNVDATNSTNNVNPYRNPGRPPNNRANRPPLTEVNLPPSRNPRRQPQQQDNIQATEQSK